MALSQTEQNQIVALINREGGISPFSAEVRDAWSTAQSKNAIASLATSISATVTSWTDLTNFLATVPGAAAMPKILAALDTATANSDATRLGPLLWALYACSKKHFSDPSEQLSPII